MSVSISRSHEPAPGGEGQQPASRDRQRQWQRGAVIELADRETRERAEREMPRADERDHGAGDLRLVGCCDDDRVGGDQVESEHEAHERCDDGSEAPRQQQHDEHECRPCR